MLEGPFRLMSWGGHSKALLHCEPARVQRTGPQQGRRKPPLQLPVGGNIAIPGKNQ